MSSNMSKISEDEIDVKDIFRVIYRYRYMIVLMTILFTIGSATYAYFQTNIYKATVSVEVGLDGPGSFGGNGDVLAMAINTNPESAETQVEIIKSRFLAIKAAEKVDFHHRYYTTRKFKEIELYYKNSPFEVGMLSGYGISFYLYPVDDKMYRLVVEEAKGNIEGIYDPNNIYCADGIAYGDITANIDPEAWRIIDGKLYLNYDQGAAVEIED